MRVSETSHRTTTEAGSADNGPPGERPRQSPGSLAGVVLDPDGSSVEVVDLGRA